MASTGKEEAEVPTAPEPPPPPPQAKRPATPEPPRSTLLSDTELPRLVAEKFHAEQSDLLIYDNLRWDKNLWTSFFQTCLKTDEAIRLRWEQTKWSLQPKILALDKDVLREHRVQLHQDQPAERHAALASYLVILCEALVVDHAMCLCPEHVAKRRCKCDN
jgi:hypothetical protein